MMYGGNLYKTFRTYNVITKDAPIFEACKRLDFLEVRRLFEAGLASPMDFDSQRNYSLIDIVLRQLIGPSRDKSEFQPAVHLLEYLLTCLDGGVAKTQGLVCIFMNVMFFWYSQEQLAALEVACRLLLQRHLDDPVAGCEPYLTIKVSKTSLYQVLTTQETWWVNEEILYQEKGNTGYWTEMDLQMLKDPRGTSIKSILDIGHRYIPSDGIWYFPSDRPLHSLLAVASDTLEEEFHECVQCRLVILLKHGLDPRKVSLTQKIIPQLPMGRGDLNPNRPMSCTELAQTLGLSGLWRRALREAGYTTADIDVLIGEDLLSAITALLSGRIEYRTRDDNRGDFIQALRLGEFANLEQKAILSLSKQFEFELGISSGVIWDMIIEVKSVFKTRKTPGSWLDAADMILMPGKDFQLLHDYSNDKQLKDWNCIREIWEIELGGVIPEGYIGSEYDHDTKRWV